jgi:death-on-curing protein
VTDYLTLKDLLEIAEGDRPRCSGPRRGPAGVGCRPSQAVGLRRGRVPHSGREGSGPHALDWSQPRLVGGNKPLAWSAARIFLLLNDSDLAYEIDEAEQMVVAVAAGRLDVPDLAVDLGRHLR